MCVCFLVFSKKVTVKVNKLKNRFSKNPLQWSCSNQQTNTKSFHYMYRRTYHENLIALVQKTVEVYYYPLRPLKWAKTQKLAPTGHFKGYDPTFWTKRHTITSWMIPEVKSGKIFFTQKPPCSTRSIPLNIFAMIFKKKLTILFLSKFANESLYTFDNCKEFYYNFLHFFAKFKVAFESFCGGLRRTSTAPQNVQKKPPFIFNFLRTNFEFLNNLNF